MVNSALKSLRFPFTVPWRPILRAFGFAALLLPMIPARAQSEAILTATPTATPRQINLGTPVPAEALPVIPPLSIAESCRLLKQAYQILNQENPVKGDQTDPILQAVISYVARVDRAYSTLPQYTWRKVLGEKVRTATWRTQTYRLKKSIPRVTALGLRADHGDIEIKYIAAIDKNKTKWEFNQVIYVTSDQPRPEICFLPLSTRLRQIQIVCRKVNPDAQRRPRLFIDAGICAIPESAKQANYHLKVGRALLKTREWAEAAKQIRKAYALLKEYQKSRRL